MKALFCFNDESGDWNENSKFYIRASLIIPSEQLKSIEKNINKIRYKFNLIRINEEIKWQDLWTIRKVFIGKKSKDKLNKRLSEIVKFLVSQHKDYHYLIDYTQAILQNVLEIDNVKIILTFTERHTSHQEKYIYKFHIQDHLQRLQMQFQNDLILIIYDSLNRKKRELFKEIHKEIVSKGDFIKEYSAISETLLFDDSYDNKLLQVVDFIAGSFHGTLKAVSSNNFNNYQKAVEFFINYIYPRLAISNNGEVWGVGIKETPKNKEIRELYKRKINSIIIKKEAAQK